MPDRMQPFEFRKLLTIAVNEFKHQKSIFGIPFNNFKRYKSSKQIEIFNHEIENPVGPAAGPHTQLTPNIISSYLCGARFIELKTVQKLDKIEVDKPCIDASDECYNVEWSQELSLDQSFDEYLKAWMLIHFLSGILNFTEDYNSRMIFNMSVGYDLEGIKTEKMDRFITLMTDASISNLFSNYKQTLAGFIEDKFNRQLLQSSFNLSSEKIASVINQIELISPRLSNSVTISTMHGCPPEEIEKIARYLISEKNLHTYVKLNPTLLGYDHVSEILSRLGYGYINLKRESFAHDLLFGDAVTIINNLKDFAKEHKREFGIKLSNTLGVINKNTILPGSEKYMSGRSLFPLTINLAYKLARVFEGDISISFSGGASAHNLKKILETGIYPVTLVTDLLKPGGYLRLNQICREAENCDLKANKIDVEKLKNLSNESLSDSFYLKETREIKSIKVEKPLPGFDCFIAPCVEACPIHQDVPEYIHLVNENKHAEALKLILSKNPLPHITGYICDHQCMFHCTRWDYDSPVLIRDIKKAAAETAYDIIKDEITGSSLPELNGINVAIIGAGPSGLSAAYFLAKAGFDVTVFEKEMDAGGVVRNIIPEFRLPAEAIENDIKLIELLGVRFIFGVDENFSIIKLKSEGFKYIYIAIGAGESNDLILEGESKNVINAIDFLWEFKSDKRTRLGKNVAVIGGGNSAMDSARAAKRIGGVENVYIIYRRSKKFMPADPEEYKEALNDGIIFKELLVPVSFKEKKLLCRNMKLAEIDFDGRRKVIPTDSYEEFEIDTVISAIGEHVNIELLTGNNLKPGESNTTIYHSGNNETFVKNVFIGGDAMRGPSTVVEAIADGKKAAEAIIGREKITAEKYPWEEFEIERELLQKNISIRKGNLEKSRTDNLALETERCLNCNYVCNKCVDVCPNRANIIIKTGNETFKNVNQILHLDDLCNECGNCETFCPYHGSPYKDKITLFGSSKEFESSNNNGFYIKDDVAYWRFNKVMDMIKIDKIELNEIGLRENSPQDYRKSIEMFKIIIKDYSFLL